MAALDEKISSLNQLHTTLKTSRTVRNHTYEEAAKKQQSSLHNTNGISTNDASHLPHQHQDVYHGCSRTRPFISTQYHKYIKRTTANNDSINPKHKYGCRCIDGNVNCRLCAKRINPDHKVQSRAELCDQNYHPVLSQKQGNLKLTHINLLLAQFDDTSVHIFWFVCKILVIIQIKHLKT